MEFLKKKWQIIVIVILILFGMNKCASSCTNENKYESSEKTRIEQVDSLNNIINIMNDSIKSLNMKVQVLEATINGNQEMINRLSQANEQISNAKKNINVNVRQSK